MFDLRKMNSDDLGMVLDWRNQKEVRSNMYCQTPIKLDEHMDWWKKTSKKDDQIYLIYEYNYTPFGVVSFNEIDKKHKHESWAFYTAACAPKRSGSRMEYLALNFAFSTLSLNKLHCEVLFYNEPVLALHKKFGFEEKGRFILHYQKEGVYYYIVRMAIFKQGWEKLKINFLHLDE